MPQRKKINPLVQTDAINALIDAKGLKNYKIAEWLDISSVTFSLMKGGYENFPAENVGSLAGILGVSVDRIRELFGLEDQHNYSHH